MNSSVDITNVLPFVLSLLGGGAVVVLLAQGIKKVFGMNSDKAIHAMVILVSGAAAIASYVLQYKNLPASVLGVSGPAIYGFSQGLYKSAKYVGDLLPKVSALLHKPVSSTAAANAADASVAAVAAPVDAAAQVAPAPVAPETNQFNS